MTSKNITTKHLEAEREHNFCEFQMSVDSETGVYWYGDRKLQAKAQISTVIEQAAKAQASSNNYSTRDQATLRSLSMKIIRTTASCFGIRFLQVM